MNRTFLLPLLAACALALTASVQAASPAKPATPAGKTVAFPPIPEGYYAVGVGCQQAIAEGRDDQPNRLVRFDRKAFIEPLSGMPLSRVLDLGNGTYQVTARSYGNGDDEVGTLSTFKLTVVAKDAFVMDGDAKWRYTHCPLHLVPQSVRQDWFEF